MKKHWKLLLFISIEFVIVITIVLLTLFAGRKSYTVTFDLNGGTYISGSLVQTVRHGQDAVPPVATKDGAFLLEWDVDYTKITKDQTITAIWEYETSYGIEFEFIGNSNYCLISGCYANTSGDVYIGANYNGMRVLGIKDGAFQNCERITGIYLLDGLISIGNNAFSGCTNLKVIDIPSTVEVIGTNILKDCTSLEKLTVPFIGSDFGNADKADNEHLGYLFGGNGYSFNSKYVPETLKEVVINGKGEIPTKAFYNCQNIQSVSFSDEITKINDDAFRKCSGLTDLIIPDTILEIGNTAFVDCTGLKTVTLGNGLKTIGNGCFANCTSLANITIGKNLKDIPENAFQNCTALTVFEVNEENPNYSVENGLLMILSTDNKTVYTISSTEYTDDFVDNSESSDDESGLFPDFGPIIRPWDEIIKDDQNQKEDDEEKDFFEDLFPELDIEDISGLKQEEKE